MRSVERVVSAVLAAGIVLFSGACTSAGASAAGSSGGTSGSAASGSDTAAAAPTDSGAPSPQASASGGSAVPSAAVTSSSANYPVDLQPPTTGPASHVMVYGLSCSAATGTASSDAFTAPVALSMIANATGGSATVKPGIAPGRYTVTVTCGTITATGTLIVS